VPKYKHYNEPCEFCGKNVERSRSDQVVCRGCWPKTLHGEGNHQWKGDDANPGTQRRRVQRSIDLTDVWCQFCEDSPAVDRHHIDGDAGNNEENNLALLCRRCHMELDGRMDIFRQVGKGRTLADL
jgi:hypothetical protein